MAEETRLRGTAVGAGYFSQFHYEAWSRIGEVELVSVCDADESKAREAASKHNIASVYTDAGTMLDAEQPDFVDIITRPDSHLELVQQAASRGIHVICQKPLAATIEEAEQLLRTANEAGVRLMVHDNFRFQPWYREIKSLIEQGTIGERLHSLAFQSRLGDGWQDDAYLARQPYFRDMPRFLVYETGVHFIDTFRSLAGEIDGVFASLRKLNPNIAGEDAGIVLFEFASGARGLWDANRYNEPNCDDPRYTFGDFLLEGNGGSIRLHSDGRLTVQPLGEPEQEHIYEHQRKNFAGDCVYFTQRHFVDSLIDDAPFETSGEEYLKTLRVQEAVYRSAATGLPVRGLNDISQFMD